MQVIAPCRNVHRTEGGWGGSRLCARFCPQVVPAYALISTAGSRPTTADVADVRQLDLSPTSFRTKFGGLFLFLPMLATMPLERILRDAGFPGSQMIPAGSAMRSLLALKLSGTARHGHVMSSVLDQGLALFAGLNVIPKRSFLTEYSCRIAPACYPELMRLWSTP